MDVFIEKIDESGMIEKGKSRMIFRNAYSFESCNGQIIIDDEDITKKLIKEFDKDSDIQILIKDTLFAD